MLPSEAAAHAFPERYDLPLPLGYYLLGAAAAVTASFAGAVGFMRGTAAGRRERTIALGAGFVAAVRSLLGIAGVLILLLLVTAGFIGNQDHWERNILPLAVWVLFWVGLVLACALVGNLWAPLNPWATLGRTVAGRPEVDADRRADETVWPAVALFFCFAWLELVWPASGVPRALAWAIVLYSLVTFVGMAVYGVERWLAKGEVFNLVLGLFGRMAPLAVRRDAAGPVLVLRPPGAGLASAPPPSTSMTALILLVLATGSFDGIAETAFWSRISGAIIGLLYATGVVGAVGYVAAGAIAKTVGLVVTPLVFALIYLAVMALVARREGRPLAETARRYVPSLVPIAIGYHLAHYFAYLVVEGQLIVPLASDPLGWGWDLFGTAGRSIDPLAVDMRLVWLVALGGIVGGHVVAVLVAHRIALAGGSEPARAAAGQVPLMALMVTYTVLSLWIMSQPIVEA